jgi:hypothetical protein
LEEPEAARLELHMMAAQAQERVRSVVTADSWRAFELMAIEDRPLGEAARMLGKSMAATFAAQKRVRQRLREEGRRLRNDSPGRDVFRGEMAREGTGGEDRQPSNVPAEGHLPEIPGFVLEDELGRGGMGVVYRAWDPSLERHVALKIIPGDPLAAADHGSSAGVGPPSGQAIGSPAGRAPGTL